MKLLLTPPCSPCDHRLCFVSIPAGLGWSFGELHRGKLDGIRFTHFWNTCKTCRRIDTKVVSYARSENLLRVTGKCSRSRTSLKMIIGNISFLRSEILPRKRQPSETEGQREKEAETEKSDTSLETEAVVEFSGSYQAATDRV